ncbi:hypothetical protein [Pseudarthrobacter sp. BIM B-2242]|uniref:hypothetical protein n=1 Tax=Pseudarthrobacter sp. BIM B-2242 TaxID=2772401 RepID=UPI00168BFFA7|nr:hypothetical protein [Pseudarthrobacter sp. BIM B-2242]QOD04442.1 hypothetical protein IDT60_05140 [Pseudarthrobacter sp. BIM B-2242]
METLKKIVRNQYFPAAAVLTAVVLFWTIAMFGGLSLLHNNQPPMATLTWLLFVYGAAVLTPLAGVIAATDLVRRWRRNRQYAQADMAQDDGYEYEVVQEVTAADESVHNEPAQDEFTREEPVQSEPASVRQGDQQPAGEAPTQSAPTQPVQYRPATQRQPAKKQPGQAKQRKTAA